MKLKNYLVYKNKLLDFARACNISITYTPGDNEGSMESSKKITASSNMSQSAEIATILHEIGHVLDDMSLTLADRTKVDKAYGKIYTDNYSHKHKQTVLEREKAAWMYGRRLAAQVGIKLGKWFITEEKEALASYRKD